MRIGSSGGSKTNVCLFVFRNGKMMKFLSIRRFRSRAAPGGPPLWFDIPTHLSALDVRGDEGVGEREWQIITSDTILGLPMRWSLICHWRCAVRRGDGHGQDTVVLTEFRTRAVIKLFRFHSSTGYLSLTDINRNLFSGLHLVVSGEMYNCRIPSCISLNLGIR